MGRMNLVDVMLAVGILGLADDAELTVARVAFAREFPDDAAQIIRERNSLVVECEVES